MFKENKYSSWYFNIITRAKARNLDGYYETHHIIPRCLGGDDSKDNLVNLTAREHFICHHLLTKCHPSNKLKYALIILMCKNKHQEDRYIPNSRVYAKIKEINSQLAKEKFTGKQKHNVGKKRAFNPASGEIRLFFIDDIPSGWIMGNSPGMIINQNGKNKGRKYYNNPETGEVIALPLDTPVPTGFVAGNPNAATAPSTGKILCYDPVTMKSKRADEIPEGWVKGSPYIWINNGIESKQFLKSDQLPEGWVKGRLLWR